MNKSNLFELLKNEEYFYNKIYTNELISILHNLVFNGDIKEVYNFLQILNKFDRLKDVINEYNSNGETALHTAVRGNHQDIAELLIQFGSCKNLVDKDGQKVVWVPVQKGGNKPLKLYGKRFT